MARGRLARFFWRVVGALDYFLTLARLRILDALARPEPETRADQQRARDRELIERAFPAIALRLCAAGQEARGCDAASSRLIDVLDAQNAGSFLTLCWREPDSNHRSREGGHRRLGRLICCSREFPSCRLFRLSGAEVLRRTQVA